MIPGKGRNLQGIFAHILSVDVDNSFLLKILSFSYIRNIEILK